MSESLEGLKLDLPGCVGRSSRDSVGCVAESPVTTALLSLHCVTVDIQWAKLVFSDTHRSSQCLPLSP